MASRNWIPIRGAQGEHSRQAHADLPEGAYEREVSKEGFFGPASFLYHRRPPTGWTSSPSSRALSFAVGLRALRFIPSSRAAGPR